MQTQMSALDHGPADVLRAATAALEARLAVLQRGGKVRNRRILLVAVRCREGPFPIRFADLGRRAWEPVDTPWQGVCTKLALLNAGLSRGTDRSYGVGGEEMATSSLRLIDGVP
jgi:hypothetical protein